MNVIDALNWRYSVKKFTPRKLLPWQLEKLLEATRLSPSSYGLQPYRIIVIESDALRRQLLPCAYHQEQIVTSSHLLVFAARSDIGPHLADEYVRQALKHADTPAQSLMDFSSMVTDAINAMDETQRQQWAHQQAYIALGNLVTSAAMMNIDTCPMGGFDPAEFDRILGLKEKHLTSTVLCAIGFRDPEDTHGKRRKVRFDPRDLVVEM